MPYRWKVLILDQHEEVLLHAEHLLETAGFDTTVAWHEDAFRRSLAEDEFDALIVGHRPPAIDAAAILRQLAGSRMQRIVVNAHARHPFEDEMFYRLGAHAVLSRWEPDIAGRVRESFAMARGAAS